jgi:hypothetical protein
MYKKRVISQIILGGLCTLPIFLTVNDLYIYEKNVKEYEERIHQKGNKELVTMSSAPIKPKFTGWFW